ncbi:MAG TPA: alpha/beta fold hydrolase [Solirubrobacterales bacterium]|nr:alpha/beta fold hydrolase [Solirubrobacterales bacterium]
MKRVGPIAYREALPDGERTGPDVVLVHGFPESSRMWVGLMEALAATGRRSIAPDLYCLGDSKDPGPATFERNLEAFTEIAAKLAPGPVALVVHDWGGFIGLAWASEHPDLVTALVISDAGFFSDGRWHGIAEAIRAPGGEKLVESFDREAFAGLLRADGADFAEADIEAYWRPFESGRAREATVEFYRSMDMEKLAPYDGALEAMAKPTLLLWGEEDSFAPLSGAHRLQREIPGSELEVVEGVGHFVFDAAPERAIASVTGFLDRVAG